MRLLKTLLITAFLSLEIACQTTRPSYPEGNLCIFNSQKLSSHCKPINDFDDQLDPLSDDDVDVSQMNSWITMSPDTWTRIEVYMNKLRARVEDP